LLDATVELGSLDLRGGVVTRELPVTEFFRGPGTTAVLPGEVLTCVRFEPPAEHAYVAWDKFGTRPAMEIAVASVGVAVRMSGGSVTWARVGYGSVAPVPLRGCGAEAALVGRPLSVEVIAGCERAARTEVSPISDVRASEAYRREVVGVMLRRMLTRAGHDGNN
jgi:CO/xanthine dehydrogenase FAD-binding subunit